MDDTLVPYKLLPYQFINFAFAESARISSRKNIDFMLNWLGFCRGKTEMRRHPFLFKIASDFDDILVVGKLRMRSLKRHKNDHNSMRSDKVNALWAFRHNLPFSKDGVFFLLYSPEKICFVYFPPRCEARWDFPSPSLQNHENPT